MPRKAKKPTTSVTVVTNTAEAMAGFPYEKYLYWFLHRQCLEPARDSFPARAWARIREKALF